MKIKIKIKKKKNSRTNLSTGHTAKNPVILPNFLVWKFCEKAQFLQNCAFPQNFHTRKLGEIMGFFVVSQFVRGVFGPFFTKIFNGKNFLTNFVKKFKDRRCLIGS